MACAKLNWIDGLLIEEEEIEERIGWCRVVGCDRAGVA